MATSTRDRDDLEDEIRLWRDEGSWIAKHVETGVTTQANSRHSALENLDEAVALHRGEIGREPTEQELEAMGIDPENNTTGEESPPDVLR